jgi:hypothetical protein
MEPKPTTHKTHEHCGLCDQRTRLSPRGFSTTCHSIRRGVRNHMYTASTFRFHFSKPIALPANITVLLQGAANGNRPSLLFLLLDIDILPGHLDLLSALQNSEHPQVSPTTKLTNVWPKTCHCVVHVFLLQVYDNSAVRCAQGKCSLLVACYFWRNERTKRCTKPRLTFIVDFAVSTLDTLILPKRRKTCKAFYQNPLLSSPIRLVP